jgi:hypothetical protein
MHRCAIMSLHADIAHAIAAGLQFTLTEHDRRRLDARRRSVDAEAYDHYLRGLSLYARQNLADNHAAIEFLERAVARKPSFAEAHGFFAYAVRGFSYEPENRRRWNSGQGPRRRARAGPRPRLRVCAPRVGPPAVDARTRLAAPAGADAAARGLALDPSLGPCDPVARHHLQPHRLPRAGAGRAAEAHVVHDVARSQIAIARSIQGRHADVLATMQAIPPQARSGTSL